MWHNCNIVNTQLNKRIKELSSVLDIDKYLREINSGNIIQKYYKTNRIAYKLFHNRKGFYHMGISEDGRYRSSDLFKSLDQISFYLEDKKGFKVLELGSGQGPNTIYLAKKYKNVKFTALDYSTKPQKTFYKLDNTEFHLGDYHNLTKFKDTSFDLVFAIESLCYAKNIAKVLSEVKRVLKPNGYFLVFDGYNKKKLKELEKTELQAAKLTATSMAVDEFHYLPSFQSAVRKAGLKIVEEIDLSKKVIPTMRRFERLSRAFIKLGVVGKAIAKILPDMFVRNAVAGYLMPELTEQGITTYYKHVLQK